MQLTVGSKVRIKSTNEGANIIYVIDEFHAKVDTFDGEITVNSQEVQPFRPADLHESFTDTITFALPKVSESSLEGKPFIHKEKKYEIDLHTQALIGNDVSTKSNEEILTIQISRAKQFIEQALDNYLQRVYIIHGVGSGRLQAEVHDMLRKHPRVRSFEHKYHPSYGMGSTEINL